MLSFPEISNLSKHYVQEFRALLYLSIIACRKVQIRTRVILTTLISLYFSILCL